MVATENQPNDRRKLTRRAVIITGSLSAIAVVTGSLTLKHDWLRTFYLGLAYPEPKAAIPGPLDGELRNTMSAVAKRLLGQSATDRAIRMLDTRAQELEGHLALQRRFGEWLDEGGRRAGAESFRAALPGTQMDLLESCMRLRTDSDLRRAWYGTAYRHRVLWDRQILKPMLEMYSRSDAWLELGYDSFPGDPSGLDSYRESPSNSVDHLPSGVEL